MHLGGAFVSSRFLFCGVHAVISCVAGVFVLQALGCPWGGPPGVTPGVFASPAQALLHAPWG